MTHYLSTIRHLTVAQIWHRGYRTIRQRCRRFIGARVATPDRGELASHQPLYSGLGELKGTDPWREEISAAQKRAEGFSQNRFNFLRKEVVFGDRIGWHDPELSQLWRYQLHYFDYSDDLLVWGATADPEVAYQAFRRLALSWINDNQAIAGDGWHPYTISRRVVNWLHALTFFSSEFSADPQAFELIRRSTYAQVRFLFSNLELDVRGNHLLENLRALICAGVSFSGAEPAQWLQRAVSLLETGVAEQIAADGGHFERSPAYHQLVFRDLLEVAVWLKRNRDSVPAWLEQALRKMADYLWQILLPDGNVPLLKDSVRNQWPGPLELLSATAVFFDQPEHKHSESFGLYAQLVFGQTGCDKFSSWPVNRTPRASAALAASGHYVIRDEQRGDYLILDAGKPCPDYLPAHAHADCLTYEMTLAGERIVVDSGVFEYRAGPWRNYFRSTPAHNTVDIGGENQSEVWSSFRVGRRARPGPVTWQCGDDYVLLRGEHDGYQRLKVPVIHQRTVLYGAERFWLVIDQLWGAGVANANSHVHLFPELTFEAVGDSTWRIAGAKVPCDLKAFGHSAHSIVSGQLEPVRQGWFSESFGDLQSNAVLTLSQAGALPFCFGYLISPDGSQEIQVTPVAGGHEITLTLGGRSRNLRLMRNESPRLQ